MKTDATADQATNSVPDKVICYRVSGSSPLQGCLKVPGDKSISHRALMLGAMANGETTIKGLLEGEDCLSTARALRQMGADVSVDTVDDHRLWRLAGKDHSPLTSCESALDMGNSGTGMRLMAGLLAGEGTDGVLVGDTSLMQRPMERIATPLRQMGVDVGTHNNGCPPLSIHVPKRLKGIHYKSPVASAQIKSCVLFAALGAHGTTTLEEPIRSRDHTERMLRAFGYEIETTDTSVSLVGGGQLHGLNIEVPGDLSSAAFLLVAATLVDGSDLTLTNVGVNPTRTGVIDILLAMGADIEILDQREVHGEPVSDIRVRAALLNGIDIPPTWVPRAIDEFPIIFVAAALAHGKTVVSGAQELKVKESNRLSAMATGLRKLGATITETEDGMEIMGGRLCGGEVHSYHDHRVAMAFAVAGAAITDDSVLIRDTINVETSFPNFVCMMQQVGVVLEETYR